MPPHAFSFAYALQAAARRSGQPIDFDDLAAVLGMAWMNCAAPDLADPRNWPMLAQDAFFEPVAQLYGITVRGLHPPEASRGLSDAVEFRQHFDASYRPLITRALEHRQPVLAWQGWGQEHEWSWALVTGTSSRGMGFAGHAFAGEAREGASAAVTLHRPPAQVYVMESLMPTAPTDEALWLFARQHARVVMQDGLRDRFGVRTGPAAFDDWVALLEADGANAPPGTTARADAAESLAALASCVAAGNESAVRFLDRRARAQPAETVELLRRLRTGCREVVAAMTNLLNPERVATFLDGDDGRRYVVSIIRAAQRTTRSISDTLDR